MTAPESHLLAATEDVPNNSRLPLLIYRGAMEGSGEALAQRLEVTFARNHWPPAWRYWIYDFPHYHSNTHEVIGVYTGEATVRLGHTAGFEVTLKPGDVLVIPAGVAHESLRRSVDFRGVGAYPNGMEPDQFRPSVSDRQPAAARIEKVPTPDADPLYGENGPLRVLWER